MKLHGAVQCALVNIRALSSLPSPPLTSFGTKFRGKFDFFRKLLPFVGKMKRHRMQARSQSLLSLQSLCSRKKSTAVRGKQRLESS